MGKGGGPDIEFDTEGVFAGEEGTVGFKNAGDWRRYQFNSFFVPLYGLSKTLGPSDDVDDITTLICKAVKEVRLFPVFVFTRAKLILHAVNAIKKFWRESKARREVVLERMLEHWIQLENEEKAHSRQKIAQLRLAQVDEKKVRETTDKYLSCFVSYERKKETCLAIYQAKKATFLDACLQDHKKAREAQKKARTARLKLLVNEVSMAVDAQLEMLQSYQAKEGKEVFELRALAKTKDFIFDPVSWTLDELVAEANRRQTLISPPREPSIPFVYTPTSATPTPKFESDGEAEPFIRPGRRGVDDVLNMPQPSISLSPRGPSTKLEIPLKTTSLRGLHSSSPRTSRAQVLKDSLNPKGSLPRPSVSPTKTDPKKSNGFGLTETGIWKGWISKCNKSSHAFPPSWYSSSGPLDKVESPPSAERWREEEKECNHMRSMLEADERPGTVHKRNGSPERGRKHGRLKVVSGRGPVVIPERDAYTPAWVNVQTQRRRSSTLKLNATAASSKRKRRPRPMRGSTVVRNIGSSQILPKINHHVNHKAHRSSSLNPASAVVYNLLVQVAKVSEIQEESQYQNAVENMFSSNGIQSQRITRSVSQMSSHEHKKMLEKKAYPKGGVLDPVA